MDRNGPTYAAHLARVNELAASLDNANTWAAENVADNLMHKRPAFWSQVRGYSDAASGIFLEVLCESGRIDTAIAYLTKVHPARNWRSQQFLDNLLPLNEPAIRALKIAYDEVGSFRDHYELARRADRAEERVSGSVAEHASSRVEAA